MPHPRRTSEGTSPATRPLRLPAPLADALDALALRLSSAGLAPVSRGRLACALLAHAVCEFRAGRGPTPADLGAALSDVGGFAPPPVDRAA